MGRHHDRRQPKHGMPRTKAMVAREAGLVPVSDHALVRFLERAGGMDVESVRMSLQVGLSRAAAAARGMGDSDFVIKMDGHLFVVRDDLVTTVLDDCAEFGKKPLALGREQVPAGDAGQ